MSKKHKSYSPVFVRTPGLKEAEIWVGKQNVTVPEIADVCLSLDLLSRSTLVGLAAMDAALTADVPLEYWKDAHPPSNMAFVYCPRKWWLKWQGKLEIIGWKLFDEKNKGIIH